MLNDYICILLLCDMFELRVITSLACINWLVWNFCDRNDLGFVFHQTPIYSKEAGNVTR